MLQIMITIKSISKYLFTALALAALLMLPQLAAADGYRPLDGMPERGEGPTPAVQGESAENNEGGENGEDGDENGSESSPSADPETGNVIGSIVEIDDRMMVVEVDGIERQIEIPEDVKVVRDGNEVALGDIQPGDTATLERNDEGEVTEVIVASEQSMDFWRGFLPVLLVVLIGFFLLTRKRNPKSA